jgi:CheY-like chemotaxis protein
VTVGDAATPPSGAPAPAPTGRTDRDDAEQTARRDLVAALSHDLRTPIAAILMWVDVLQRHPEQLARGLQAIERSARTQTALLDRAVAALEGPPQPMPASAAPELAGVKVLVVEDDADVRQLLAWSLEERHATVVSAGTVDEALTLLASERPDVLLSDIGMPDRDGFSLIRAVRGLDARDGGQTPAVALTAFARPEDRTRALLAGYQFHLAKPADAGELIAAIAALAGRRDR